MSDPAHLPLRKRASLAARANVTTPPAAPPSTERSPTGAPSARSKGSTCFHCGTTETPLWRKGPSGPNTLCNACGTRWRRHGTVALRRPISTSTPESRAAAKRVKRTPPANPPDPVVLNSEGPAAAARSRTRERRPRCVDCGTSMLSKERAQRTDQPTLCAQCEMDRIASSRRSARLASNRAAASAAHGVNTRSSRAPLPNPPDSLHEIQPAVVQEPESNDGLIAVGDLDAATLSAYNQTPNRVPWAEPDSELFAAPAPPPRVPPPNVVAASRRTKPTHTTPAVKKEPPKPKPKTGRVRAANQPPGTHYVCASCGTTETPLWRKGPLGKNTLCNACGTRWMRHGSTTPRPPSGEFKSPIARKRKPAVSRRSAPRSPEDEQEVSLPDEAVEGREIPYLPPLHESIPGLTLKRSKRARRRTERGQSYFDSLCDVDEDVEMTPLPLVLPLKDSAVRRMNTVAPEGSTLNEMSIEDTTTAVATPQSMDVWKSGEVQANGQVEIDESSDKSVVNLETILEMRDVGVKKEPAPVQENGEVGKESVLEKDVEVRKEPVLGNDLEVKAPVVEEKNLAVPNGTGVKEEPVPVASVDKTQPQDADMVKQEPVPLNGTEKKEMRPGEKENQMKKANEAEEEVSKAPVSDQNEVANATAADPGRNEEAGNDIAAGLALKPPLAAATS